MKKERDELGFVKNEDVDKVPAEKRTPAYSIGEILIFKGWKFRVKGANRQGMFVVPVGPA